MRVWLRLHKLPKPIRLIVVGVAGGVCLVAGIIMIFTPGPALVLIPLGLLLLASEFQWAERCMHRLLNAVEAAREKWRERRRRRAQAKS
jgi:hypothetical protein